MVHFKWIERPSQEYLDMEQEHELHPFPQDGSGAIIVCMKIPS